MPSFRRPNKRRPRKRQESRCQTAHRCMFVLPYVGMASLKYLDFVQIIWRLLNTFYGHWFLATVIQITNTILMGWLLPARMRSDFLTGTEGGALLSGGIEMLSVGKSLKRLPVDCFTCRKYQCKMGHFGCNKCCKDLAQDWFFEF